MSLRPSLCFAVLAAVCSYGASAQYIGGNAPLPPLAPQAGTIESPEATLARNVRLLAIDPRSYVGLLGAGRASLRLGDAQSAIGFFGRAEEVNPASWVPKWGQGAALVAMEEPQSALGYFAEAQRLGASLVNIAADRGLAFDLLGRQPGAQADYRVALNGVDSAEARRRLALSLAVSGNRAEALATLDPLLRRRDPGALRARAFVLALSGDPEGARNAVNAAMPGMAAVLDPFFRRLPGLQPAEKVAAVHFGHFPDGASSGIRVAIAAPVRTLPPAIALPVRVPAPTVAPPVRVPQPTPEPAAVAPTPKRERADSSPLDRAAIVSRSRVQTPQPIGVPAPIVERAPEPFVLDLTLDPILAPEPEGPRLAELDRVLAQVPEPGSVKSKKVAAERKAVAPAPGKFWVQLAGGSQADRMPFEYRRLKARKPSFFAGRTPYIAELKGWSRLLLGPFKSEDEAQEAVNALGEADIKAFGWASPAGQAVEKLPAK